MRARDALARGLCALRDARHAFVDTWRGLDVDEPAEPEPAPPPAQLDLVALAFAPVAAVLGAWSAVLGAPTKESS